jgi:RNA polymerase sigma-70 factor (ECF subfamily)
LSDEANTLERAKAGEPEAFQELVRPHLGSIRRFARSFCKNESDADDLAQDALVKAYRSFGSFDGRSSLSTWLFTIAKHQFLDHRRGKLFHWRSREVEFDDSEPVSQPNPEHLVRERERIDALWVAVRQIDEKYRTPLVLAEVEGLSYEEIATIESIPIGTVRSRIARAKEQLKGLLVERLEGNSGASLGTNEEPATSHPMSEEQR